MPSKLPRLVIYGLYYWVCNDIMTLDSTYRTWNDDDATCINANSSAGIIRDTGLFVRLPYRDHHRNRGHILASDRRRKDSTSKYRLGCLRDYHSDLAGPLAPLTFFFLPFQHIILQLYARVWPLALN